MATRTPANDSTDQVTVRPADTIWHEQGGWFDARWHFSFDRYRDPEQMGVGALRVFNDDRIIAGAEWPLHPHQDIESLTYVVEGDFLHADSLGNNGRLEPGAAQVMTFSHRGDQHSEKNGSADKPLRFIQFWILPSTRGLETRLQQRQYTIEDRTDRWLQIMGPAGTEGLDLAQDARALVAHLTDQGELHQKFEPGRGGYLHVIEGRLDLNGDQLATGEAAKVTGVAELTLRTDIAAELILIDVPLQFERVGVWAGEW
jgi:redox-sensitive bicupin YhaK (pirin superfamily)